MEDSSISAVNELNALLDSKLIVTTKLDLYDVKLVDCGDYVQVYKYQNTKTRKSKDSKNEDLELNSINIDIDLEKKKENKVLSEEPKEIKEKNIIRSKLECQRIAKANMNEWKTFITLTFAENETDIKIANKKFRYFVDKMQRVKKDFKYICIPEFQKRGAIHYHMLCNIDINDSKLIYAQEDNKKFKHIKYWIDGFTKVDVLNSDAKKVVGYISKYMTKDIDNRLFNRHRYFYSRNLQLPKASYIDLSNTRDEEFFNKKIQDKHLIYENQYINPYDNQNVVFLEYLKEQVNYTPKK